MHPGTWPPQQPWHGVPHPLTSHYWHPPPWAMAFPPMTPRPCWPTMCTPPPQQGAAPISSKRTQSPSTKSKEAKKHKTSGGSSASSAGGRSEPDGRDQQRESVDPQLQEAKLDATATKTAASTVQQSVASTVDPCSLAEKRAEAASKAESLSKSIMHKHLDFDTETRCKAESFENQHASGASAFPVESVPAKPKRRAATPPQQLDEKPADRLVQLKHSSQASKLEDGTSESQDVAARKIDGRPATEERSDWLRQWLQEVDGGVGCMLEYFDILEKEFEADIRQIAAVWEPGNTSSVVGGVDPFFWNILGVTKMGHKMLFAKAIARL